ncbi:unnamed protein product [Heterotrigona itama]|uniref:Uncharacterized protein n=1 Tax=Heterotrigona itama TaxID=395501 RepID=A0A6V7HAI2_9HYME|nr:unnamed protein product [Heterotrigona itama]
MRRLSHEEISMQVNPPLMSKDSHRDDLPSRWIGQLSVDSAQSRSITIERSGPTNKTHPPGPPFIPSIRFTWLSALRLKDNEGHTFLRTKGLRNQTMHTANLLPKTFAIVTAIFHL